MDLPAFFSVFGLVFLAELGDKTQMAVVAQTCRHRRPWAVFIGATGALTAVTALGVVAGQLIGGFLPPAMVRVAAAIAFLVMGGFIAREAICSEHGAPIPACLADAGCDLEGHVNPLAANWRALRSTFALLFVAELGDKTQLAVLTLSGEHQNAWAVLGGGALALAAVTALGVAGGQLLCEFVSERTLLWISAFVFVAMGVLLGTGVL